MIKILASFEHEVEGKICKFMMDHDTSIAIAKEMGLAFLKYLGNVEDAFKAEEAAKKAAEAPAEADVNQEAAPIPSEELKNE